jgi:Zinc knuckle
MNGNVFECFDEHSDRRQFAKTVEALQGYCKKNLRFSEDLAGLFADPMVEPRILPPDDPGDNATKLQEALWTEQVKTYSKRIDTLRSNLAATHAVIWGQCSEAMKSKIKSITGYKGKADADDCFWLLQQIKAVTLLFDEKRNPFISAMDALKGFLNCRQNATQTPSEYLEELKGWADTIEYRGGTFAMSHELVPQSDDQGRERTDEERRTIARDTTLAIALIKGADPTRYGTLITAFANSFAMGKDEYPTDLSAAYGVLVNYKTPENARPRNASGVSAQPSSTSTTSPESSALTFAQRGVTPPTPGSSGAVNPGITCFNCNLMGHYSTDCPSDAGTSVAPTGGVTLLQHGLTMAQSSESHHGIDSSWILLDSQSTISIIKNPSMLKNIRPSRTALRVITNGGFQDSTMVGDFPNLGEVWYNRDSIANILSLAAVRKVCRVTMDTAVFSSMFVHRLDGSIMEFIEQPSGLYVFKPSNNSNVKVTAYTMVSTVAGQKKLFTNRQVAAADAARDLYRKLGRPSEPEFQSILRHNLIRNCPVTPDDARRALLIYGPDIAVLKGKTTRSSPAPRAPTFEAVPIPAPVLAHHRNVTLCADFFFVQGICFLHTISRDIGFRTVKYVPDRTHKTILRELAATVALYHTRGFAVRDVHADHEFECVRADLLPLMMNIVPADCHVGEIERSIRTIKERLRSTVHGLPFKRIPKLMLCHMVDDVTRCLNMFPRHRGVSDTLSPAGIVTGAALPDFNTLRLEFGSYVQVFEDVEPTNTPRARTLGAIALTPTGNAQGAYNFLSLATGARISRHNWHLLPITDTAIARVEALALHDGQPLIQDRGLVVEWRPDHPIDDSEYDRDYDDRPLDDEPLLNFDPIDADELADLAVLDDIVPAADPDPRLAQGAPHEPDDAHDDVNDAVDEDADIDDLGHDEPLVSDDDIDLNEAHVDDADGVTDNPRDDNADAHENDPEGAGDHTDDVDDSHVQPDGPVEPANETHMGVELVDETDAARAPEAQRPHYNLRNRSTGAGAFRRAIDSPHSSKSYYPPAQQMTQFAITPEALHFAVGLVLTQMTARAGIRKHGKRAENAMTKEFAQMEDLKVYHSAQGRPACCEPDQREARRKPKGAHLRRWATTAQPIRKGADHVANGLKRRPGDLHHRRRI